MDTLQVSLDQRSYPIHIGAGILSQTGEFLSRIGFPQHIAVVTNTTVAPLYAESILSSLRKEGFNPALITVADGEEHKNLQTLQSIYDQLIGHRLDRGCGLVALGGGVIGDMAGFAAATFLRGIPYVQIPTTLLAQVDSSVGGKTAVNLPSGKNLIGAFYQPRLVIIDTDTLNTLDNREVAAGLAEVVKYGMIQDRDFFSWIEDTSELLLRRDPASLAYAIRKSCQIKADIVEIDEREGSIRAYLNFGHTFGHAIEHLAGYGRIRHGEAVSIGMMVAAGIAMREGLCQQVDVERLKDVLLSLGLPVDPPVFPLADYIAAMERDKKVQRGELTMVLNRGIGEVVLHKVRDLHSVFSPFLNLTQGR